VLLAGVALLCLAPAAAAAGPCASAPLADSHKLHLVAGGWDRSALVHVPHGIPAGRPVPLVLALHGWGSSGRQMERYSGFSHQAELHGFVVAYPDARDLHWNITADPKRPDDVAFAAALIADLGHSYCIDRRRTFAAGVSNGAGMVALLACALSSQIAAIAPVAGDYDGQPPCRTSRPESVLEIHGTDDQDAPYFGAKGRASGQTLPAFVRGWVHRDRCGSIASTRRLAAGTMLYRWGGCSSGSVVEHVQIRGGLHQWPGALPPDPGPRATICGSCTIWSFFSSLTASSNSGGAGLS
jgi:polyhydroxybutyrate depolymerase